MGVDREGDGGRLSGHDHSIDPLVSSIIKNAQLDGGARPFFELLVDVVFQLRMVLEIGAHQGIKKKVEEPGEEPYEKE